MTTDSQGAKVPASAWGTLAILVLFYVVSFLDRQIIAMMVDPIRKDLGVGDFEMSLLMGFSFACFYTVFGLLMGAIVDRHARRVVVYWGVTLWSLATALSGLAQNYAQLFVARMVVGVGEATLTPAAYSILSDSFPRRRLALAIAIFTVGSSMGAGISMAVGGLVISLLSSSPVVSLPVIGDLRAWQIVYLAVGVPGVLIAALIFLVPEPLRRGRLATDPATTPGWGEAFAFVLHRRALWMAVLLGLAPVATLATGLVMWAPTYMSRNFGWTPVQFGPAIGVVVALAGAAGQVFNGWYVDRLFARGKTDAHFRHFLLCTIVAAPIGIAAFLVSNPVLFLILFAVPNFLLFTSGSYGAAAIQMTTPNRLRGRMGALFLAIMTIPSLAIGPSLIALLAEYVFKSEQALGLAMATVIAILIPFMLVGGVLGMRAMRALSQEESDALPMADGKLPSTLVQARAPAPTS